MSDDPQDQLLLHIRAAVAEYERTLIAERMRRGRQAKLRSGQLLPWTRAPYGYLLDAERPRDPSRVRLDPVQAAVVEHMFAWYGAPGQPVSLYAVAKRLSEAQLPTPRGGQRWNVAAVRGILRSPVYIGIAYSGRTRPAPVRRRKSAIQPVGPGQSEQPAPADEWIAGPVPAIIRQETFEAVQQRLDRNIPMARRHNTTYEYLLRGLVSCGQCRLACSGRTLHPGYHYYFCRGRTDALRLALGERCTARYAPARALDDLVWHDLCRVLRNPALIIHELERAQRGAWLPQALQARRQTRRDVLAPLERQQARLLDLYLAEVIEREEFERKRKEVMQTHHGLTQQLRQLDAQAQQHVDVASLAQGIEAFCRRTQSTLDTLTFVQRRQLVELLIDRVIVNDSQVEIRYVVPTGPKGETTPFCHVRLDYLNAPATRIPLNALDGVLHGLHGNRGQQQPLNRLPLWRRLVFMDLHGPQCHGRQAFSLAVARRTPGQSTRAQRQPGFPRGLRATPWYGQEECTDHGLGLNSGPEIVLRRTDTPIPRGAHQQLNARRALGSQHVIDVGFAVPYAAQARLRTTSVGMADSLQAPEPFLTFFLGDGQRLAPGAFAHIVGLPCPDLLRQQPQGHTLRRDCQGTMDKQALASRMSQGPHACGRPQTRPVHLGGVLHG
jgi:site-specific DNA recombinase